MCLRRHLLRVLVLMLVVRSSLNEFRFCHYGPQKVTNQQCPYGLMFNKPVASSCVYYANDQSGPFGEPELFQCGAAPKSLQASGERLDNQQFQGLFLEITDPNDKGEQGKLGTDCESECLNKFVPPDERSEGGTGLPPPVEEPEYDDMVPAQEPWDEDYHKNLTVQLFLTLMEDNRPQMAYMRTAKLLNRSFTILRQFCDPYIPAEFTDQLYRGFLFLVFKSREKVADIGAWESEQINTVLDRCKAKSMPINISGIVCNNYTRITGYSYKSNSTQEVISKDYVIEAKAFRWGKYDPVIEGAFLALDFVHGFCFNEFKDDLNMHHIYQAGIEPLFTRTIMQRWPYPPKLKRGDGYWNNILEAKDAKTMMQNMDACAQLGYALTPFEKRLNRPFNKFYTSIGDPNAAPASGGGSHTNGSGKSSGWTGTVDEYWEWYTKNDALQEYLKLVGGTCLKTDSQLNEARTKLEHMCPS